MIERGDRIVDRISLLDSLAAALGVTLADLDGPPSIMVSEPGKRVDAARAIREAMISYQNAAVAFNLGAWDLSASGENPRPLGQSSDLRPMMRETVATHVDYGWELVEARRLPCTGRRDRGGNTHGADGAVVG